MNWAYLVIVEGLVLSVVLNLIFYGIYKLTNKEDKEDKS